MEDLLTRYFRVTNALEGGEYELNFPEIEDLSINQVIVVIDTGNYTTKTYTPFLARITSLDKYPTVHAQDLDNLYHEFELYLFQVWTDEVCGNKTFSR